MDRERLKEEISTAARFSFARSGGPGGQNVNKVNSKVLLSLDIDRMDCLKEGEKVRIREKLKNRMNTDGELFIQIQEERSQLQNRGRAIDRMTNLIIDALKRKKKRKPTKPSKASQQRRLDKKRMNKEKKQGRGRVSLD